MFISRFVFILFFLIQLFTNNANAINSDKANQKYLNDMLSCQLLKKEFEWSNSLWPQENKIPKPQFSDVIDIEHLKNEILSKLNQEALLKNEFNFEINNLMLQNDLNRMAMNTKDSVKLKALFKTLDNNPEKIANCISRLNIIDNKLHKLYYNDKGIHANIRALSIKEIELYEENQDSKLNLAIVTQVKYKIKNGKQKEQNFDRNLVLLTRQEFDDKLNFIINHKEKLIEKSKYFTYLSIVYSSKQEILVEKLTWEKQNLSTWIKTKPVTSIVTPKLHEYILPAIIGNADSSIKADYDLWRPYSTDSRINHTAIWTGSKMLIWGGFNGGKTLNTGLIYDPTTDVFTKISTVDAPSSRQNHTAVWTGTKMIVWGGNNDAIYYSDGNKYDPDTDTWSLVSNSPLTSRENHTANYDNDKMVIWGGNTSNSYTNTGSVYTVSSDSWQMMSTISAPSARSKHAANLDSVGDIVIWGGFNGNAIGTGSVYDISSNTWTVMPSGLPRYNFSTANFLGRVVYFGGIDNNGNYLNNTSFYNPTNNAWGLPNAHVYEDANVFSERSNLSSVLVSYEVGGISESEVIVWGGCDGSTCFNNGKKLITFYNSTLNITFVQWANLSTTNTATARKGHTAISTESQVIYFGGENIDGGLESYASRYVPVTSSWIPVDSPINLPEPRTDHKALMIGSDYFMWGGSDDMSTIYNTGYTYSYLTDTWSPVSTTGLPTIRSDYSMIWTGSEVVIWGGSGPGFGEVNTGAKYNVLNNIWNGMSVPSSAILEGRFVHSAVWTGVSMIVWGGGCCSDEIFLNGAKYTPSNDLWEPIPDGLATKLSHFAFWTGNNMIVWGGFSYGDSSIGYSFDGASWTAINHNGAPTVIDGQTIVSSDTDMIVWGGEIQNKGVGIKSFSNNGYKYSFTNDQWSAINTIDAPDSRGYAKSVWTGSEYVFWGGENDTGNLKTGGRYNPDTDTWQAMTTANAPDVTYGYTMTWTGNDVIIWGGIDGNGVTNDMDLYFSTSFDNSGGNTGELIFKDSFEIP